MANNLRSTLTITTTTATNAANNDCSRNKNCNNDYYCGSSDHTLLTRQTQRRQLIQSRETEETMANRWLAVYFWLECHWSKLSSCVVMVKSKRNELTLANLNSGQFWKRSCFCCYCSYFNFWLQLLSTAIICLSLFVCVWLFVLTFGKIHW